MVKNIHFRNIVIENNFVRKPIFAISIIGIIAIAIRLYYFIPDVPISADALNYFIYASDTSLLGHLPSTYSPMNNGWPAFVSLFFSMINLEYTIQYMQIQSLLSIVISVITIIPIYFLCRIFFNSKLSILGGFLFVLEPRIIQNSVLGITESLYIFLGISSLVIILKYNSKLSYVSFILVGLCTIVRSEGLFLFAVILIVFVIKNKKNRLILPKIIFGIIIFFLIIFPMSIYKIDTIGNDGIISRFLITSEIYLEKITIENEQEESMIIKGFENFPMYLGWDLIPIFIFFVPIGVFFLFREIDYRKIAILSTLFIMSIPAFYAYSIPLKDTRYLYFLYPIFCVISIYPIEKILEKIQKKNIVILLIMSGVVIGSITFLEIKLIDEKHEEEYYSIAQFLVSTTKVVNDFPPESRYLDLAEIPQKWPLPESESYGKKYNQIPIRTINPLNVTLIEINDSVNLEKYILDSKDKKLSHIIINDVNSPEFLKDIFYNENKYMYLKKIFDSEKLGYKNNVKIFQIDYQYFDSIIESKINE